MESSDGVGVGRLEHPLSSWKQEGLEEEQWNSQRADQEGDKDWAVKEIKE